MKTDKNFTENMRFEELSAKKLSEEMTLDEKTEWEKMISETPDLKNIFAEYSEIFKISEQKHTDFTPETAKALSKTNQLIEKQEVAESKRRKISVLIRVAATVILILGLLFVYKNINYNNNNSTEIRTIGGKYQILQLSDGSTVWLNENSQIQFPEKFSDSIRRITLKGEAYFKISKNKSKPFVVECDKAEIRVLGTEFNLRSADSETKITVSLDEGRVEISNKDKSEKIVLAPGEQAVLDKSSSKIVKNSEFNVNITAWKTGVLKYKNSKLKTVVADLSEIYHRKIMIENSELNTAEISGRFSFRGKSVNTILEIIAKTFPEYHIKTDSVGTEIRLKTQ
jgi:ferric-dicitrate binding protein FerR (iron transport regulator)